jgi:hypothetical protein
MLCTEYILNIYIKEKVFITIMMLTCFKLFYIKDNQNAVENSVDSIKKQNHNGFPFTLITMSYTCSCDLTFRGREEREENNYFAKFYRKKMK